MTMYHVLDAFGREVFKSEDQGVAKRAADAAKIMRTGGCDNFHVEKRERVYTTTTLEEAIKGTPFDPGYVAPASDAA